MKLIAAPHSSKLAQAAGIQRKFEGGLSQGAYGGGGVPGRRSLVFALDADPEHWPRARRSPTGSGSPSQPSPPVDGLVRAFVTVAAPVIVIKISRVEAAFFDCHDAQYSKPPRVHGAALCVDECSRVADGGTVQVRLRYVPTVRPTIFCNARRHIQVITKGATL